MLERRVAKLVDHLETTEERLAVVARMKAVDPGIASVYRSVQGLDRSDPAFGLKAALMQSVFEANLELRRKMGG